MIALLGASRAEALTCATTKVVKQAGGADCTTISQCVALTPASLSGNFCIDIQDSATYNEQVTVQNIATNGYQVQIGPLNAANRPAIDPPTSSTAAFQIANNGVDIVGVDVQPANPMAYGVEASSSGVIISSVNVQDASGNIWTAGISAVGVSTISYSSVTVENAYGIELAGDSDVVSYSTMSTNGSNKYGLYLLNSSYGTIENSSISSGTYLVGSSNDNVISFTTMTNYTAYSLYIEGSSNTINNSYASGVSNKAEGIYFSGSAAYNKISFSTSNCFNDRALTFAASHNTVSDSFLYSHYYEAAYFYTGSYNTVERSTMTNSSNVVALHFLSGASSNTVTHSYAFNSNYYAAEIDGSYNTISASTMVINSGNEALYLTGSNCKYNTITDSFISAKSKAIYIESGANNNTIRDSTATSLGSSYGLYLTGSSDHNAFSNDYLASSTGQAVYITGSHYTTISGSTITSQISGDYAAESIYGYSSGYNVFSNDSISSPNGYGLYISYETGDTISLSTITASYPAIEIYNVSSATVDNCYAQGSSAIYIGFSTGTAIGASVLVNAKTINDDALQFNGGNVNLTLSSSTLTGGPQGAGVYLGSGNMGLINLSSNTINAGSEYGIYIATPAAGAQVWITSNTILPTVTTANNTYGIYFDGLTSGATIYNNGIYYRTSGSMGSYGAFAVYGQSSSGIYFHHNRIDEPGEITAGSYFGVTFSGVAGSTLKFNDQNAVAVGVSNAFARRMLSGSNGNVFEDNVVVTSFTVTGSSASLLVDGTSHTGNVSDYNDLFSDNGQNTAIINGNSLQYLGPFQGATGEETHSIAADPLWHDVSSGVEDFHPQSKAGRYDPSTGGFVTDAAQSPTIDAGDPAEDYSL
ncbi:MAG: right-handed parallel beta-helix repeat-containing protein, partial [Elusimicrobia bacterium]|nr:right-handed parallel beta-helix repeat-containing protein [Elusimicrobiota bacterium]